MCVSTGMEKERVQEALAGVHGKEALIENDKGKLEDLINEEDKTKVDTVLNTSKSRLT